LIDSSQQNILHQNPNMSERIVSQDPLKRKFLQEAHIFEEKYPEEGKKFLSKIIHYAVSKPPEIPSAWAALEKQINLQVEKLGKSGNKISTEEFIENLFIPNGEGEITADIIMARLLPQATV